MTECTKSNTEKTEILNTEGTQFSDLNLNPSILATLNKKGFTTATPIQAQTLPFILEKRDLIAQAQTGSGKTLAFALPAIQHIENGDISGVLVLVPTRELAEQVADEFKRFGGAQKKLQTTCIIGRQSYDTQIRAISRGANAVIATPGRLIDLLESGKIKSFQPDMLVLDEADEMLNMGFIEDIRKIFSHMPKERQTIFFSATFPPQIKKLAKDEQKDPAGVYLNNGSQKQENPLIEQSFYVVSEREREIAILRLMEFERPSKSIIFCRTKRDVETLQSKFIQRNIKAKSLHGDLSQSDRTMTIKQFKAGIITTLIATDVASRGIDVSDVSHVFNFHVPENRDRYTHRIGRTGRAGRTGKAITLTTSSEWQSHFFLRGLSKSSIKFCQIPTSEKVQAHLETSFVEQLNGTDISSDARKFCEKIATKEDCFEVLCKLYTLAASHKKVEGPSRIGLTERDITSLLSRSNRYGGGSSRGSRFGRSSGGAGRSYGRSNNRSNSSTSWKNKRSGSSSVRSSSQGHSRAY